MNCTRSEFTLSLDMDNDNNKTVSSGRPSNVITIIHDMSPLGETMIEKTKYINLSTQNHAETRNCAIICNKI